MAHDDDDRAIAALQRELDRARAERRWVDADEIASAIEARRAQIAKVVRLADRRKAE